MDKKRLDCSRRSFKCFLGKKAQLTIFMILGLILLFAFIFIIRLSGEVKKGELEQAQESTLSKLFEKEALRIFVEDCLDDELEKGLILIGKQGRFWSDQPGGTKKFQEGISGITYSQQEEGGRVFYGITAEHYSKEENAYPCDNDSFSPEFCQYKYPDTDVGFGSLELKSSTLESDLRRYLINRTVWCVNEFAKNNISSKVNVETGDITLDFSIHDDGIDVKIDYPLTIKLEKEEFFHLSRFDFFYPTKFKGLLEAAVIFPLMMDWKYVDFNYTKKTLESPSFVYGNEISVRDCSPYKEYYLCNLTLHRDEYSSLGIEMRKEILPNGDDLFVFQPALYQILQSPEVYEYRFVRQNRAPALDYINRSQCPAAGYDYLVIKDDPGELGDINISLFAIDADEDGVSYNFAGDFGKIDGNRLDARPLLKGFYNVTAYAVDEHGLKDWQEIRILADREIKLNVSLWMPYTLEAENKLLSYRDIFNKEQFFVSREDPVFIEVNLPENSLTQGPVVVTLAYNSSGENFLVSIPYNDVSSKNNCFSLPSMQGRAYSCSLDDYTEKEVHSWPEFLSQGYFDFPHFASLANDGKLNLSFSMKYCARGLERSTLVDVSVKECIPNVNPEHPFAYPYQDFWFKDGVYAGEAKINPLEATHSCCSPEFTVYELEDKHKCFVNPQPGCYGRVEDYTLLMDAGKKSDPNYFAGYVLEEQYATCDGTRGNACFGPRNYGLWQEKLVCGENTLTGCQDIKQQCQYNKSWGYVDTNGDEKYEGWCHGTMGCTKFCSSAAGDAVVYIGEGTEKSFNINALAKESKIMHDEDPAFYFRCGCAGWVNKKCDSNFDGKFNGLCAAGAVCAGDS